MPSAVTSTLGWMYLRDSQLRPTPKSSAPEIHSNPASSTNNNIVKNTIKRTEKAGCRRLINWARLADDTILRLFIEPFWESDRRPLFKTQSPQGGHDQALSQLNIGCDLYYVADGRIATLGCDSLVFPPAFARFCRALLRCRERSRESAPLRRTVFITAGWTRDIQFGIQKQRFVLVRIRRNKKCTRRHSWHLFSNIFNFKVNKAQIRIS